MSGLGMESGVSALSHVEEGSRSGSGGCGQRQQEEVEGAGEEAQREEDVIKCHVHGSLQQHRVQQFLHNVQQQKVQQQEGQQQEE